MEIEKKICLYGIRGIYNYGCEAMVSSIFSKLKEMYPKSNIAYLTYDRGNDRKTLEGCHIVRLEAITRKTNMSSGEMYVGSYKKIKNHVAILTWHYYTNYGSALQAYALQESIKALGYDARIIDYRNPKFGKVSRIKNDLKVLISKVFNNMFLSAPQKNTSYLAFQNDFFQLTKLTQDVSLLPGICRKFDVFVCGSDQIWAPNVFNSVYMLDFVNEKKKKVSYAASIGLNDIPDQLCPEYRRFLSSFHAISVREKHGSELLEKKCGIKSDVVLDPTFLIDATTWENMEKKHAKIYIDKFLFCYFLNNNHCYKESVIKFAQKNGYVIIGCSANTADSNWFDEKLDNIGPQEFLWFIHNAGAVITDSYHGTIFSLLYHKEFITIQRFMDEDKECQNSRINQLKSHFNISNQIVKILPETELEMANVNYDKFEIELKRLRKQSLEYLKYALEG